jgi:hypothetical protein
MSMEVKVTCDACNTDITTTENCVAYRIIVESESVPSRGNVVTLAHRSPPYTTARHFCGRVCLQKWASEGAK